MHSMVRIVPTAPIAGQQPGTSGLRKKTRVFMEPCYLENFIQSIFDAMEGSAPSGYGGETLVIGGDGRYYNRQAIQVIVRMAAASSLGRVLVGRGGLLSTPAMSAVIRRTGAMGGILLTASHNPGGIDEDFGVKYNVRNGGPAPEQITERIYARTLEIDRYLTLDVPEIDLDREGQMQLAGTEIVIIDPLSDYTSVMESLFDFQALRDLFRGGFQLLFDAMHGVTGPYARHIFEECLGAPEGTVLHGTPLEDFGGDHPDPNQVHAEELVARMNGQPCPDLGAACDGDGDRNLILAPGLFVTPGDSLAIIAEHACECIPGYRSGLAGVARSMPTSMAVDRVARQLGIPCFETPTGWKFFGNLMDAGLCTLCGEESFGTGSNHVREKDGLWAVLCWLSIIAARRLPAQRIVTDHWQRFGRSYFQRHDFEALDAEPASNMIAALRESLPSLTGRPFAGREITAADDFSYSDPVDGSVSSQQGIRIFLSDGSRVVCRLSGTGTEGATLRIYLEEYQADGNVPIEEVMAPLVDASLELLRIEHYCGRTRATVIT
jgi:phosphoglucomutase